MKHYPSMPHRLMVFLSYFCGTLAGVCGTTFLGSVTWIILNDSSPSDPVGKVLGLSGLWGVVMFGGAVISAIVAEETK